MAQKRPLLVSRTMPLLGAHPTPNDGEGPSPISQAHHQQLMVEADLAPIDYETDLAVRRGERRPFQQAARQRLVPGPNSDGSVVQKATQAPGYGGEGGPVGDGDLGGDLAQMHRAAQPKARQKPAEVAKAGDAYVG